MCHKLYVVCRVCCLVWLAFLACLLLKCSVIGYCCPSIHPPSPTAVVLWLLSFLQYAFSWPCVLVAEFVMLLLPIHPSPLPHRCFVIDCCRSVSVCRFRRAPCHIYIYIICMYSVFPKHPARLFVLLPAAAFLRFKQQVATIFRRCSLTSSWLGRVAAACRGVFRSAFPPCSTATWCQVSGAGRGWFVAVCMYMIRRYGACWNVKKCIGVVLVVFCWWG